ncbi:UvrD-helicase domain-containing protein [Rhodovulum visakhapatnamense]|uniref:DNA 3'-5' helicase II n=1 Tax=Rhodovulum visakhapatnamense TaxID=364297 RepID=A0A4R8F013_9RHOB|nr:UvrD-helicase domain-containing protein [Rhodovulum visakhapatnamense]TDX18470.1 DNA helicase-2/ATP-dependent DNA helicase PcrA [Rhodovulum visakhapatnamense]
MQQDRYRLSTIDGWALRILKTFPARSGIAPAHLDLEDARRDYPVIKTAIAHFLSGRHIDEVLSASYSRVIVDEYQDCDPDQHSVVCHLATILPTVILGDPMQEIFNWRGHHPNWDADVLGTFPLVAELTRPWRWENAGAHELGTWLLEARRTLKAGDRIDLLTAPDDVDWVHLDGTNDQEKQRLACLTRSPQAGGEVLIMTGGTQKGLQRRLAKQTPGAVTVEAVDLTDVTDFASEIDLVAPGNLEAALDFAFAVMTGIDRQSIALRATTIAADRNRTPPEAHELAAIKYREVGDAESLIALFDALEATQGTRTFRPEILRTCIKALRSSGPDVGFLDAAKRIREQQRILGRLLPKKAVGSPLLLKGLEGDVAVILDASDFDRNALKNRKNLYVAMTRGSRKLVVCSSTHLLG